MAVPELQRAYAYRSRSLGTRGRLKTVVDWGAKGGRSRDDSGVALDCPALKHLTHPALKCCFSGTCRAVAPSRLFIFFFLSGDCSSSLSPFLVYINKTPSSSLGPVPAALPRILRGLRLRCETTRRDVHLSTRRAGVPHRLTGSAVWALCHSFPALSSSLFLFSSRAGGCGRRSLVSWRLLAWTRISRARMQQPAADHLHHRAAEGVAARRLRARRASLERPRVRRGVGTTYGGRTRDA